MAHYQAFGNSPPSSPPPSCGGGELATINHDAHNNAIRRRLRASVRCINFLQLFQQRVHLRRKFRAAVQCILLTNRWNARIVLRRQFRAMVQTIIYSKHLLVHPNNKSSSSSSSRKFDLEVFQNTVRFMIAVHHLERHSEASLSSSDIRQFKNLHDENTLQSGLNKLADAVERVRHGEGTRTRHHSPDPILLRSGMQKLSQAVEAVRQNGYHLLLPFKNRDLEEIQHGERTPHQSSQVHKQQLAEVVEHLHVGQEVLLEAKKKKERPPNARVNYVYTTQLIDCIASDC
eukprot:scaffold7133_cov116-Cylindrotheca_fusiformis.AAC.5